MVGGGGGGGGYMSKLDPFYIVLACIKCSLRALNFLSFPFWLGNVAVLL